MELKLSNGYAWHLPNGSTEYVEFFSSNDDGVTWTTLGLSSFTAWDAG